MLDPLTALSVASNIVSFVDFVVELIKEADTISTKGSAARIYHGRIVTNDLISLTASLQARTPVRFASDEPLKAEEQALDTIVAQCDEVAQELILVLQRLSIDQPASTWQSCRAALRTVWSSDKVEKLMSRLDSYRRETALRILVLLNAKSDAQSRRQTKILDTLQRSTKDVVEVISITSSNVQANLEQQTARIIHMHEQQAAVGKQQHEEIIAAILTLRDGNTQVIARPNTEKAMVDVEEAPLRIQKSYTFQEGVQSEQHSRPPRITDRVEEISPAYERTFQWIFQDPKENDKPWSNFLEWLQYGSGCYWINGKAGSGKSTLMKYILHDIRSRRAIAKWAAENDVVVASFFLWNMGTPLQKSQAGLIRALLLDVLQRHPGLIPTAFPGLCRHALSHSSNRLAEPSFPELKKAMLNLVNQPTSSLRMCFFIDGIDEYEGDEAELIDLLKEVMSCSTQVKMVLSSRPTPTCVDDLSEFPSLRLQDLTHDDIQIYVEDKLDKHRNMKRLKVKEATAATRLISDITTKASGVFLWIVLVVKSLLQGLVNHDRISDLRRRLDVLPEGLEKLYEHMLRTMTPIYRQQASQLFQIVLASMEVQHDQPLTALQLAYAEDTNPRDAIDAPSRLLTSEVEQVKCEATEARIRSRCCGLLEVQEKNRLGADGLTYKLLHVGFLHKTVIEFLNIESHWSTMLDLNTDTLFDPHKTLMSSCLFYGKTADLRRTAPSAAVEGLPDLCRSFLIYTRRVEEKTGEQQIDYMDEFEHTLVSQSILTSSTSVPESSRVWKSPTHQIHGLNKRMDFLALRFGLISYVTGKLEDRPGIASSAQGSALLREALCQFVFSGKITEELGTYDRTYFSADSGCRETPLYWHDCIGMLLAHRVNPNVRLPVFGERPEDGRDLCSPWEMMLDLAIALRSVHKTFLKDFEWANSWSALIASTLKLLMFQGAEPNAVRVSNMYSGSSSSIIERLLTPSWFAPVGSAQALSAPCRSNVDKSRAEIMALLTDRSSVQTEWVGGKLIMRQSLPGGSDSSKMKSLLGFKKSSMSTTPTASPTPSPMPSPLPSPNSRRSGGTQTPMHDPAQHPGRTGWLKRLLSRLAA
ncbi:hypothetical protein LTS07_004213 [Exophiala sideris]|uniref:NACHT domain-containing protein n=1 Tax=Exophiala sideris TaxID=1016849 RepID=A0ABR0JG62_9EURO|nr:hypothetical protein LTS07_004213 [Exophiala sideris]KAK5037017.1 hypothetical protein LTR13_004822 [Exophiala sideris]KAK5062327.1 hypothetical protein LTR69_004685 [Exophiala sideris]KAK5182175.1 hypothetical protein LTR44_005186 [Eurotiomycetes sp. CCFEE 6388]